MITQGRVKCAPPPKGTFAPPVLSALWPTAPRPTALRAFAVLQCAHQRRVSFARRLSADARPYKSARTTMALLQMQLHVSVERLRLAPQQQVCTATVVPITADPPPFQCV